MNQSAQVDLFSQTDSAVKEEVAISNFSFLEDVREIEAIVLKIKKHQEFGFQLISDTDDALISKITGVAVSCLKDNGYYFRFI